MSDNGKLELTDVVLGSPPDIGTSPLDLEELRYGINQRAEEPIPTEQYMWLLRLFGSIRSLHVSGMGFGSTGEDFNPASFPLPALRVSAFSTGITEIVESFLEVINLSPSVEHMASLDIGFCTPRALQILATIVNKNRGTLTFLGCDLNALVEVPGQSAKLTCVLY